jgi:hypothetical protein
MPRTSIRGPAGLLRKKTVDRRMERDCEVIAPVIAKDQLGKNEDSHSYGGKTNKTWYYAALTAEASC